MINSLCLYFKSCRMLIRSQMQYRASFLMQTFTQLVMMVTELLAVLILMDRFPCWVNGTVGKSCSSSGSSPHHSTCASALRAASRSSRR